MNTFRIATFNAQMNCPRDWHTMSKAARRAAILCELGYDLTDAQQIALFGPKQQ